MSGCGQFIGASGSKILVRYRGRKGEGVVVVRMRSKALLFRIDDSEYLNIPPFPNYSLNLCMVYDKRNWRSTLIHYQIFQIYVFTKSEKHSLLP